MNVLENEKLLAEMRAVDTEAMLALAPQWTGNRTPVGSQWDYDAGIAQARLNFKKYLAQDETTLEQAFELAVEDLTFINLKKNERYKREPQLQRCSDHGIMILKRDHDRYSRALEGNYA